MSFKSIMSRRSYWKSVVILGFSFLIIYNLVTMFFQYGGFEVERFFRERTADGKLFRFIFGQLASGFVYGLIIAYGQFRIKEKEESRNP